MADLWVLTTAPGSRVGEVENLVDSINADYYLVVANPPDVLKTDHPKVDVITYPFEEFNISKWWDYGLSFIDKQYENSNAEYDILLIESDARMSNQDIQKVRRVMREESCVMAGADWQNCLKEDEVKVRRDNSVWVADNREPWQSRLPGMAVLIEGGAGVSHGLHARLWYADDDAEWRARENGGTVLVGGTTIYHQGTQGPLTGELEKYAIEDKAAFLEYWGGLPDFGGKVKSIDS